MQMGDESEYEDYLEIRNFTKRPTSPVSSVSERKEIRDINIEDEGLSQLSIMDDPSSDDEGQQRTEFEEPNPWAREDSLRKPPKYAVVERELSRFSRLSLTDNHSSQSPSLTTQNNSRNNDMLSSLMETLDEVNDEEMNDVIQESFKPIVEEEHHDNLLPVSVTSPSPELDKQDTTELDAITDELDVNSNVSSIGVVEENKTQASTTNAPVKNFTPNLSMWQSFAVSAFLFAVTALSASTIFNYYHTVTDDA